MEDQRFNQSLQNATKALAQFCYGTAYPLEIGEGLQFVSGDGRDAHAIIKGILEAAAEQRGEAPDTVQFNAFLYSADRPCVTAAWDKASRAAAQHPHGTKFFLTVDSNQLLDPTKVAMRTLVGKLHSTPNTSVSVANGEALADFYAAEGRSTASAAI